MLSLLTQESMHAVVDRLSNTFEAHFAPKPIWKSTKITLGVMEKMVRPIVPCRLKLKIYKLPGS
jgi:transcriptional regulator